MATLIEFQIKGVKFSTDASKLNPESTTKAFNKAHARVAAERWTGKKEKSLTIEQLQAEAVKFAEDPNQFWAQSKSRGVRRAKFTPIEEEANRIFTKDFFPEVKLNVVGSVALWKKAGAVSNLLKAKKEDSAEVKGTVDKNLAAKDKIIKALVTKLTNDNWQPKKTSLAGLSL